MDFYTVSLYLIAEQTAGTFLKTHLVEKFVLYTFGNALATIFLQKLISGGVGIRWPE